MAGCARAGLADFLACHGGRASSPSHPCRTVSGGTRKEVSEGIIGAEVLEKVVSDKGKVASRFSESGADFLLLSLGRAGSRAHVKARCVDVHIKESSHAGDDFQKGR